MARSARKKSPTGLDHVIVKGMKETILFKEDSDKDKYIELIKNYMKIYPVQIYAYCFMTTHAHFFINSINSNLSMFMKSVNQSYAAYYNTKYDRIGHVFFDRFKNITVLSNKQTKNLSLYIHRNPKDISGYKHEPEKYKYSSLSVYFGLTTDNTGILDISYVLNAFDFNIKKAIKLYWMMMHQDNLFIDSEKIKEKDIENQKSLYEINKINITPTITPENILDFIKEYTGENFNIHLKYDRINRKYTSIFVLLVRSFCNLTYKNIGMLIGDISSSTIGKLCAKGLELTDNNKEFSSIHNDLINFYN
ncbi:MAG: transposase [Clostridiaceae bacterium]